MAVVTVSGQIGSGAREVGRLVADALSIDYVDQEILVEAAQELGVPVESVVTHDERAQGFGERLAGMLRRFLERSAAAGAGDPMLGGAGGLDTVLSRTYTEAALETPEISDERYVETLSGIVRDLAGHDDVLIIGRGSQVILKDWPNAVHVLCAGPLDGRIDAYAEREGLERSAAAKRVREGDRGRCEFHEKFFKVHPDDPSLYHVSVNTARYSHEDAARIISDAARAIATTT